MKTPTTPESRGPKLKQAQLPFARTPTASHPRPPEATPPAKKPRLDEPSSPPVPRIASPVLLDDDSVESITCEPVICNRSDESEGKADSTLNDSALTSDQERDSNKSTPSSENVDPPKDKLTPNATAEKKSEWAIKRQQREQERRSRELERIRRKMAKDREKEEKEQRKIERELERKEREEIKRLGQEERERKKKERQIMKENRERRQEEDKIRKLKEIELKNQKIEEDLKRKEEDLKRKEEEKEMIENKKKKAAAAFISFFVPKEKQNKTVTSKHSEDENTLHAHKFLSNFTIKSDMRLAPIVRHKIDTESKDALDKLLLDQSSEKNSLYLSVIKSMKSDRSLVKKSGKTWPIEDVKNDLIIIEDDLPVDETKDEDKLVVDKKYNSSLRAKLFSFHENRRPPYWGTFQRKSKTITGRKPFNTDSVLLDYDCDSDEEWEEEEPGESVESIAGSDDEEDDNEYDVDNDFMVPHGYLSDEEALGEDDNALTPEALKAKLQYLEHEFEDEMKKPTKIKKPRVIGIVWQNSEGKKPDTCPEAIWNFLTSKSMIASESEIIINSSDFHSESNMEDGEKSASKKSKKFPDELIPDLIKLIHGNTNNRGFLVKEFQKFISNKISPISNSDICTIPEERSQIKEISNVSVARKIKELSTWMPCSEQGAMYSKMCWFVERAVREKYDMMHLQLPNDWSYLLVPRKRIDSSKKEKPNADNKESPPKKESNFNIKKFTKKLTQEEIHKQFTSPTSANPSDEKSDSVKDKQVQTSNVEKKRVSLKYLGPRDGKSVNSPSQNVSSKLETVPKTTENKKRVALLSSVPLADSPKPCRTNLLTQFINTAKEKYSKPCDEMEVDDCIVLSE